MPMHWWALPGPRSFIDAVVDDIRQGKSVLLCLPENTPDGVSSAIQVSLEADFEWLSTAAEPGAAPIDFLYELTVPEADPARLRNQTNLTLEDGFRNKIIWLDDVPATDWTEWSCFFAEYERVSRAVPEARRSYFIVPLKGNRAGLALPEGVGLSARRWDAWLLRHDMQVYSTACVEERKSGLETDLVAALVSVLGGWDPELCDYLAGFDLRQLLDPGDLLSAFAGRRNWSNGPAALDQDAWRQGLWQTYLNIPTPHTCFAVFLNGSRHLDHLLWKAEVGVLMPYIEEQRQKLIELYRMHFKLPHYTRTGVIEDVYDLEIGMIEWILSRVGVVSKDCLRAITTLKDARNRISHLMPVDPDLLLRLCRETQQYLS